MLSSALRYQRLSVPILPVLPFVRVAKHIQATITITTLGVQQLFLGRDDADLIKGKKILIVDDVISTGGSLHAMETLVAKAGGTVAGRMAVLAEGDAKNRDDIKFLAPLPTFKADGSVR